MLNIVAQMNRVRVLYIVMPVTYVLMVTLLEHQLTLFMVCGLV
jgi:hypothetical protein